GVRALQGQARLRGARVGLRLGVDPGDVDRAVDLVTRRDLVAETAIAVPALGRRKQGRADPDVARQVPADAEDRVAVGDPAGAVRHAVQALPVTTIVEGERIAGRVERRALQRT